MHQRKSYLKVTSTVCGLPGKRIYFRNRCKNDCMQIFTYIIYVGLEREFIMYLVTVVVIKTMLSATRFTIRIIKVEAKRFMRVHVISGGVLPCLCMSDDRRIRISFQRTLCEMQPIRTKIYEVAVFDDLVQYIIIPWDRYRAKQSAIMSRMIPARIYCGLLHKADITRLP